MGQKALARNVQVLREPDAMFHWVLMGVAIGVLVLSCVLRVEGHDKVVLPGINQPIPGVCTYKRWFGVSCPGCGLTRCFISMAHANLAAAWEFNPAGVLFYAIVLGQVPYRALQVYRIRRGLCEVQLGWISHVLFWSFFSALAVQWILRMFVRAF